MVNEIRQGDVYWLNFGPISGSAPAQPHPCIVVQSDSFNRSAIATTVVCLIMSNMVRAHAPGNVTLKISDLPLRKLSVVSVFQVTTVDKFDLKDRIGRIPSAAMTLVLQGLQLVFASE